MRESRKSSSFGNSLENFSKDLGWQTSNDKIRILNPSDFVLPKFMEDLYEKYDLNVNSLGISDSEEIKKRLEVTRMLFNQDVRERINVFEKFFAENKFLPSQENEFLRQYENGKSVFWDGLHELIQFLKQHGGARKIESLIQNIEGNLHLEKKEAEFTKSITEKLKSVALIEGVVTMNFGSYRHYRDSEISSHAVVGKKKYNSTWGGEYTANIPRWLKSKFSKSIGLQFISQELANLIATKKANRSAIIVDLPTCIISDIKKYFSKDEFREVLENYERRNFTFKFIYSDKGLCVNFLNIEGYSANLDFTFKEYSFSGFTKNERKSFKKQEQRINKLYSKTKEILSARPWYSELEDKLRLFSRDFYVNSDETDSQFKWYALQNLYTEDKTLTSNLNDLRLMVYANVKKLKQMADVVAHMQMVARLKHLDVCVPELTESGSGTSFINLAPIEVFHKNHKLVPFTLPTINGRITCLTGRHGGGKSVAGKSILSSVYLAQSGLPVFAKEFKTELKTVMGSIVNDEGEGSTATIFVEKVKSLFKGIGEVPPGESIVFIDEIGKGTQEAAGINIGKKILRTVKERSYSLIFNSQILQLAEFAEQELGAKCFVVNKDHEFVEGIGDGQMDELLKEKGLDKYLV